MILFRNGLSPCPSILVHPHNFNFLSTSCALIHFKTALISSSVSLFASSFSTSSKSSVSHCDADTMAVLLGDGRCIESSFFQEEEGALKATANIAFDGVDKYVDTSTMKPTGKSLNVGYLRQSAGAYWCRY